MEQYDELLRDSWKEFSQLPRMDDAEIEDHPYRAYIWTIYGQIDRVMELEPDELGKWAPSGDLLIHAAIQFGHLQLLEFLDYLGLFRDQLSRHEFTCFNISFNAEPLDYKFSSMVT